MVELKTLKIKKQVYKFEVRKKFQHVKRLKVREKRPIDTIKETLLSLVRPKKSQEDQGKKTIPAGRSNPVVLYGAVFLALFVVGFTFLYLYLQSLPSSAEEVEVRFGLPEINLTLVEHGVLSYGSDNDALSKGYSRINYEVGGLQNMTVTAIPYGQPTPSEVFLLRSKRDEAQTTSYPLFKAILKDKLGSKGIHVNEIDIDQIETIPKGAFLVVPSGRIPYQLLGVESTFTLNELAERGVVVIYMGLQFDRMINKDGLVTEAPKQAVNQLGYNFDTVESTFSTEGFRLGQPFYKVKTISGQSLSVQQIYGSVSVVKKGSGAVVFIPQTLDGGWRVDGKPDPEAAAGDMARLVMETKWIEPSAEATTYFFKTENGSATGVVDFFTGAFKGQDRYTKIQFNGKDIEGNEKGEIRVVKIGKRSKGELYLTTGSSIISSEITSQPVSFTVYLKEEKPGTKLLYLKIYRNGQEVGERRPIATTPVNLQNEYVFDESLNLDTGEYIAAVEDDDGKEYAEAALRVVFADIEKLPDVEDRKIIPFRFLKDNSPVLLKRVKVTVLSKSGTKYGEYNFNDVSSIKVDVSKNVPNADRLPYGDYTFRFKIGEIEKDVPVPYQRSEVIFEKPEFIGAILFSVLILGIGLYFRRQEAVVYLLDIPDFPPVAKTKIPVRREVILAIFAQVNEYYKWNFTPLTPQEVKGGFKNMMHQGRPIYVTDFNIEYLLDRMVRMKLLQNHFDYYAPLLWEKETGKTGYYLCVFRKLRDIFVNNAVPFSTLKEEEDCDTKINLMGQDMFVHVYDKKGDINRLAKNCIKTANKGLTIIVFGTEDQKADFMDLLYSPSSASTILKLEVETNSVLLHTAKEFEAMIQEMKG